MRVTARGFTLLEVLVGLVLMATVLVAIILAAARHKQLLRLAADRQAAIDQADRLLQSWSESATGIPLSASQALPIRGWRWRTSVVANRSVFGRVCPVVRLEVLAISRSTGSELVLASVDTLRPPLVESSTLVPPNAGKL